jgi:LacI family transcriptional regulator
MFKQEVYSKTNEVSFMSKNVKMADIAKRLNVSIVSVSKALANKDGVSEETKKQILQVAEELGYVKSSASFSLEERKTIVVVVAARFFGDSSFYSNMYNQLLQKLNNNGFITILEIVSTIREKEAVVPNSVLNPDVVGVVFMGEINRDLIRAIAKTNLPYVFLDFYDSSFHVDSVVSDSAYGSYSLTKHLIDKGLKNIAFVGSFTSTSSIMDRYLGYYRAMVLAGNEKYVTAIPDRDKEGNFIKLSLPSVMPEGFVCNCDEIAFRLLQQLRDKDLKVPGDVSVVGYDGSNISVISTPSITTYKVDILAMSEITSSLIIRLAKKKRVTPKRSVVQGELILRDSSR